MLLRATFPAKFGFVKYRYRLHAETAKKELHDTPAFGDLCPNIQIGESSPVPSSTAQSGPVVVLKTEGVQNKGRCRRNNQKLRTNSECAPSVVLGLQ